MLIVQLSDTHIVARGRKTLGIAPMASNLVKCVDSINQLNPKPDVVLVTGDVTDNGHLAEAEHAANLLNNLECPYFIIPGNHDDRRTLRSAFGQEVCPSRTGDFINFVVEDFEVRLIGLDSVIQGAAGGELCKPRLAWLDARLQEAKDRPTIIFMHHPPVKFGVLETDVDGFVGADLLGDIIEKHPNIEQIMCGHIHLLAHARWRGTVISTAPSTGMQLALDLTMQRPSEFFLEAPGYRLHHWTSHKCLTTHTIYVREPDGPYLFE